MLIQKMRISEAGPFREPVVFDFDPDVNVLIGPNSSGKSTVLQLLLNCASSPEEWAVPFVGPDSMPTEDWPLMLTPGSPYVLGQESFDQFPGFATNCRVPVVFVPSVRLPFPTTERVVPEYVLVESFSRDRNVLDGKYVYRVLEEYYDILVKQTQGSGGHIDGEDGSAASTFASLIASGQLPVGDDETSVLIDGVGVADVLRRTWQVSDLAARKQSVIMTASQCAYEICLEVMADSSLEPHSFRPTDDDRQRGVSEVAFDNWKVNTVDNASEELTIGDLSSGTQGPFIWLLSVAMEVNLWFMELTGVSKAAHFRTRSRSELEGFTNEVGVRTGGRLPSDGVIPKLWNLILDNGESFESPRHDSWQELPFVLVIDEIENHLHPTWQRRVIPALRKYFPNVQIFATTHSPFAIAGLKAGQVHLLNRDENGVITATTNKEDINGWTADEILRVFMGVKDPTDSPTAEAAEALRKLRDEGPRADEREEEQRQAQITRLRSIVDRAELAGHRVAEDDRFLTNLEAILERYRQDQDLGQENR